MKIILVRHGETLENASRLIQGHLPGQLSEKGRRQAEMLGRHLKNHVLDHVYSSDLARARETAAAITRHHPGVPVVFTEALRERFLGPYQGRSLDEVDLREMHTSAEVESSQAMVERARVFLDDLRRRHNGKTVVLVAHGGTNAAIRAVVTAESRDEVLGGSPMNNAAFSLIEYGESVRLIAWNITDHLESQ